MVTKQQSVVVRGQKQQARVEAKPAQRAASRSPRLQLPAGLKGNLVGYGAGVGGNERPVFVHEGVVWCGCAAWVGSARRPRTCSHVHDLAVNAYLPKEFLMSSVELAREARGELVESPPTAEVLLAIAQQAKRAAPGSAPAFPPTLMTVAFQRLRLAMIACIQEPYTLERLQAWVEEQPRRRARYTAIAGYTGEAWRARGAGLRVDVAAPWGERSMAALILDVRDAFVAAGFRVDARNDHVVVYGRPSKEARRR